MRPQIKVVILGLTNSGKSTIAEILKSRGWPILEIDDMALLKNNAVWPEDEMVLDKLFKEINEEVLKFEDTVFVTSFLETNDIKRFHEAGFKIVEIHASYDELRRRKNQRDGVPKDKYERFNRNYKNYQDILSKTAHLMTLSLDSTDLNSEEIATNFEKEFRS